MLHELSAGTLAPATTIRYLSQGPAWEPHGGKPYVQRPYVQDPNAHGPYAAVQSRNREAPRCEQCIHGLDLATTDERHGAVESLFARGQQRFDLLIGHGR